MVLSGFSGGLGGAAAASGFRAVGLALVLIGAGAMGLTEEAAALAKVDFGFAFAVFPVASFAGAAFVLLAATFGAAVDFADTSALAAGFLTLLATGLVTGFLAAVATIDSSVVDTALKN